MDSNIIVRFAKDPGTGPLPADTFDYSIEDFPTPKDGEFVIETVYTTIDAGSRAMLGEASDYLFKVAIGGRVPTSGIVGRIVASRNADWKVGSYARVMGGFRQRYLKINPPKSFGLTRIDPAITPLAASIGLLGITGFTGWLGTFRVGQPKPGETFLVSAAAGAVGTAAGQFAKIAGARVVGIAGGPEKCAFLKDQLGFDDCIDYRQADIDGAISRACPNGVDIYFENVGGVIQKAAFGHMNRNGRIPLCGQVSQYEGAGGGDGPNLFPVAIKRLRIEGFVASDHGDLLPQFIDDTNQWLRDGRIRSHSSTVSGMENLHDAINALTSGRNIGQQLHQVGIDPSHA